MTSQCNGNKNKTENFVCNFFVQMDYFPKRTLHIFTMHF